MRWLLIDVSWLAHRVRYALADLSFDGEATGILYGLMEQLRYLAKDLHSNRMALFFDSVKSMRRNRFPDYKANRREHTPEEWAEILVMSKQVRRLRRDLTDIGFPCYRQVGMESDDLIAQAVLQLPRGEEAVIITGDKDLCQCITDDVSWYDPTRDTLFTPFSFFLDKGVEPRAWAQVKAMAGCPTDNVPGIPGVGEKTAADFIKGILPSHYKRTKAILSEEGRAIIRRNKRLVELPHPRTKPLAWIEPNYNFDAFEAFCDRYGLSSLLQGKRRNDWERIIIGRIRTTRRRGEKRGCIH